MKKFMWASLVIAIFLVTAVPAVHSGGRSHGGGHGGFWGPFIIGGIVGGLVSGMVQPYYYNPPVRYYYEPQPQYYAPLRMCYHDVNIGYWSRDYYGNQYWVSTGYDHKYFTCE